MLEALTRAREPFGPRQAQQRQRDVVERAQVRHQRVVLEHQPDMALLRRQVHALGTVAPEFVADADAPALRPHQAGEHAQHRGLAGARWPDERQQLARLAAKGAGQRHGLRLLDRQLECGRFLRHRRSAARADAKKVAPTASSDNISSSSAMRSALARSKACTRS
jgi:hypothetical protein